MLMTVVKKCSEDDDDGVDIKKIMETEMKPEEVKKKKLLSI